MAIPPLGRGILRANANSDFVLSGVRRAVAPLMGNHASW